MLFLRLDSFKVAFFLVLLFIFGCSKKNQDSSFEIDPLSENGIVILKLDSFDDFHRSIFGRKHKQLDFGDLIWVNAHTKQKIFTNKNKSSEVGAVGDIIKASFIYLVDGIDNEIKHIFFISESTIAVTKNRDFSPTKTYIPIPHEYIAISIPAGTYVLRAVNATQMKSMHHLVLMPSFKIKKKEVLYIGDISVKNCTRGIGKGYGKDESEIQVKDSYDKILSNINPQTMALIKKKGIIKKHLLEVASTNTENESFCL